MNVASITKQVLDEARVIVKCSTCELKFLDVSYSEFLAKHRTDVWDKWFCDLALHWLQNQTHDIISNSPNAKVYQETGMVLCNWNVSDLWREVDIDTKLHHPHDPLDKVILKAYNESRSRPF